MFCIFYVHQRTVTGKSHTLQLKVKNKDVQAKGTRHVLRCLCCFKAKNSPLFILVYAFFKWFFVSFFKRENKCECLFKRYCDFTDDNKIKCQLMGKYTMPSSMCNCFLILKYCFLFKTSAYKELQNTGFINFCSLTPL